MGFRREWSFRARLAAAAIGLVVAAVAAALAFRIVPVTRLVVCDGSGKVLQKIELAQGRFDHVFVHSVHLTPVFERFRVEKGGDGKAVLHLYELRYQSSGVGMPSDAEGGYRLEDGFFVLSMDRRFAEIPLRVSIVAGHGIEADGRFLPFTRWAPERGALILKGETTTALVLRRF